MSNKTDYRIRHFKCDSCSSEMLHMNKGVFICPKCGCHMAIGDEEEWKDYENQNEGYSYEEIYKA